MTKPPPARQPPSTGLSESLTAPNSPEKKKQKKKHTKTSEKESIHPKQLFTDIDTTKYPTTPLWNKLRRLHPSQGTPYTSQHVFSEEGRSLHKDTIKATAILAKTTNEDSTQLRKHNLSHAKWESLLQGVLSKPDNLTEPESSFITQLIIDLSKTAPFPTFQTFQTDDNKLRPTLITTLWQAAQMMCGSNYTPQDSTSTTTKTNPVSTFLQALQRTPTTKTKISKPATNTSKNPYKQTTIQPTKKANNPKQIQLPSRKHRERYDMKIHIDPTAANPITGFIEHAKEWLETMKTVDPTIAILPWFKASKTNPILSPNDIPLSMKNLRHYFHRLTPKSGTVWTKIHVMLDQDPKEITSGPTTQMGWWYKENDEGLYLRPLCDAETTQDLGILAYTSNFTNTDHTMELINAALRELGCKFPIGGKLRRVKSYKITEKAKAEHKAKGGNWQNQYWFALHLIADINHQRPAIRYLYRLFNQKNRPQPGGLRARFIPNEGVITMSSSASSKRFKMLDKHKAVIQSLQLIRTDSIITLDDKNATTNYTLRHYLSTLQHSTTQRPLYHSVDFSSSFLDEGSNAVILTAHKEHADEAAALASVLPALCQQKLHMSTSEWFTDDALDHCDGVIFDQETNRFTSQEDTLFDDMLDEDFGHSETIEFEGLPEALATKDAKPRKKNHDDNSFVSFGTTMDLKKTTNSTSGTDSFSSPTFLTDSINEQQAESLAASNAENEELRKKIQELLLEKAQCDDQKPSSTTQTSNEDPNASYSPTFNPPSPAGSRSKASSQSDE